MTDACHPINAGMTIDLSLKGGEDHCLGPRKLNAGTKLAYPAKARSFWGPAHRVKFDGGILKSSPFSFAE